MRRHQKRSGFEATITDSDVAAVRSLVETEKDTEFVRDRRARNVEPPAPELSREHFWYVLMGCLLTTQQRSTKGMPVNRFLEPQVFPLTLGACGRQASVEQFVLRTIKEFGGIRRGITIASQAANNWTRLNGGKWQEVEGWFEQLQRPRAQEPQTRDKAVERQAARWADENLAGLGPKQGRNLWQWLGLSRYEIPLDSRVTDWINSNLSFRIDAKRLVQLAYYEAVLDHVQDVCERAGVLPCVLDASAFDYEDLGRGKRTSRGTTQVGFVNPHGQVTIRNTGAPGTDHYQYVYQLACSHCGHVYGANGTDIHERLCPACQEGRPGTPLARV